jgi:hypothetical protein
VVAIGLNTHDQEQWGHVEHCQESATCLRNRVGTKPGT